MEIKKTVAGVEYPANAWLVVEDPEAPSTWHLRYRDANGNIDHRLLGACWAALHSGYRGNKYEGPDKEKALNALKALYAAEDMPLPTEEQEASQPSSELLAEMIKQEGDKWVIYSADGSKKLGTYDSEEEAKRRLAQIEAFKKGNPNMTDEQAAAFSKKIKEEGSDSLAESDTGAVLMIGEGAANGYNGGPVVMDMALIEPGWGNKQDNHFYPAEVLKRDAPKFEHVKMYLTNHVDGEHTVRNEVAEILQCPIRFTSSGAPVARVGVFDAAFAENVRNRAKLGTLSNLQCSILGKGDVQRDAVNENGRSGHLVKSLIEIRSVDFVPRAGAGGRVLNLVEMEANIVDEKDEKEKDKEGQVDTVVEDIREQDKPMALDSATVLPLLMEADLPHKTVERLAKRQFFKVEEVQAAIAEWHEAAAEIQEAGRPRNLGPSREAPKPDKKPEDMHEAERQILVKHGLIRE